jgi:P-type Ca2+ transporter type 2C
LRPGKSLDDARPRSEVCGAFTEGVERRIDTAEVNGRLFLNNVSLGIYGDAVRSPAYRDAKVRTLLETAAEVMGPSAEAPGLDLADEAAVMILTDDNFSTIVKAVELGRGLYDNLTRYIRYQIGGMFGYIATFLGASILNIAGGIPLLPLQSLWVSFATLSAQSVGLGYAKAAAGLMDRPRRPPSQPILTRELISWLSFVGLLMAIGTLAVISWADQAHGLDITRTMGMVTFALFLLFFSIEAKDDQESAFSVGTFSDKTFARTTVVSIILLILSTVLGIFHHVMKTVTLNVLQWLICG